MKKKGFTLIELLAVIVILAVLALILTPIIQDLITNAGEAAFRQTINGILSSAENYAASYALDNNGRDLIYPITFTCDGTSCKDENNNKLDFNGKVPITGTITITEESIVVDNLCDEKHCGSGSKEALIVSNEEIPNSSLEVGTTWIFEYNGTDGTDGSVQSFNIPVTGAYKLEVWGAQGGNYKVTDKNGYSCDHAGGNGGYSNGSVYLEENTTLYITVGGKGKSITANSSDYHQSGVAGGYNGGGSGGNGASWGFPGGTGGGGATNITTSLISTGELKHYNAAKDKVLIVAGGGGGAGWETVGGAGGGLSGVTVSATHTSTGGTQTEGYAFGQGSPGYTGHDVPGSSEGSGGSGSGYYGGSTHIATGSTYESLGGAGGSGYIGELKNASTIAGNEDMPTYDGTSTMVGNADNGYAKITYLGPIAPNMDFGFNYTGQTSTFKVPQTGTYKLEVWGAQGGGQTSSGGYGGYSVGEITLRRNNLLYITVGGTTTTSAGGYNGGGTGNTTPSQMSAGGGGATHISTSPGELKELSDNKQSVIIAAGGGGGEYYYFPSSFSAAGGHAGGYKGNDGNVSLMSCFNSVDTPATGGNQSIGGYGNNNTETYMGVFGQGGSAEEAGAGGGGGYYGGGGTYNVGCSAEGAAGGSGFIAFQSLINKKMVCYNCTEDKENEETYTEKTTCANETPQESCAKIGSGYVKITFIR